MDTTRKPVATVITGTGIDVYRAAVMKTGLKMYRDTGMRPNRAYTPSAMMKAAAEITGKKFKPRDYTAAIDALQAWIDAAPKDGIKQVY